MEWIIESYDRRTDRDGEIRFTTEAAFIRAGEGLLRNGGRGFVSATLPDGTIVRHRQMAVLTRAQRLNWLDAVVPEDELLRPMPVGSFRVREEGRTRVGQGALAF